MKKALIILSLFIASCTDPNGPQDEGAYVEYDIEAVDYEQLLEKMYKEDDQLVVVNFWATWCVPCVEELPHFMEVNREFRDRGVRMVLVSLDKKDQMETGVKKMKDNLQLETEIYLLDDVKNMNYWISDVDENWSGAIPATVMYKNGKKLSFKEGKLSKTELRKSIQKHL